MSSATVLRTLLAAAAIAACLLAAPTVRAAGADEAQVTVVSPGGGRQTVSLAALAGREDVVGRTYTLGGPNGQSAQTVTGFSPAAILDAAGTDPYGFSYLEALRPAGGSVLLSRHQALDPGAFGEGPPVLYATATGTGFLRPSSGSDDLNATDSFTAPQGLTLILRKGEPLQVEAKASTGRTRLGRAVAFTAIVERAGSGERLSYSWYFDDGHSATGASVRHSFAERGSYDVVVGVTAPGDSTGASAVVTVQVGAPLAGPDREGGGRDRDAAAPDHGAATGGDGAAAGADGAGPSSTAEGESAESAAPSAPAGAPDSETEARRTHPEPAAGERVSGVLVRNAAAPPPEPTPSPAARTGSLGNDGRGGPGLPDAALGLLVTAGLLGAGALVELRGAFLPLGKAPGGLLP